MGKLYGKESPEEGEGPNYQQHAKDRCDQAGEIKCPLAADDICDNTECEGTNSEPQLLAMPIPFHLARLLEPSSQWWGTHARPALEQVKIRPCRSAGTPIS